MIQLSFNHAVDNNVCDKTQDNKYQTKCKGSIGLVAGKYHKAQDDYTNEKNKKSGILQ